MFARSCSLIDDHRAISSSVRAQPVHKPVAGSIAHTWMQGERIGAASRDTALTAFPAPC
jgi:hypothetical protein